MFIANIISNKKQVDNSGLIFYSNKLEECNLNKPTLIIGCELVKELYPNEKIKYLERKIKDNIYWTFHKTENRVFYEKDLDIFFDNIIEKIKENNTYNYLNILIGDFSEIKNIINFIKSDIIKTIYIHYNSFIYINYGNETIGISQYDLKYLGIKKEKFVKLLKSNKNNRIIYDNKFINEEFRKIIIKDKYTIPYLYNILEK